MDQDDLEQLINDAEDCRSWISKHDVPDPIPIEYYDDHIEPERLEEIEKGTEPREEEFKQALDTWLMKLMIGDIEGPEIKSMSFIKPDLEENRKDWLVIETTGSSFEGIECCIYGRFKTKDIAIRSLSEDGFLDGYI